MISLLRETEKLTKENATDAWYVPLANRSRTRWHSVPMHALLVVKRAYRTWFELGRVAAVRLGLLVLCESFGAGRRQFLVRLLRSGHGRPSGIHHELPPIVGIADRGEVL